MKKETLTQYILDGTPPAPELINEVRHLAGLTIKQLSDILYVKERTVYLWLNNSTKMPFASWELLLLKTGLINPGQLPSHCLPPTYPLPSI